MAHRKQQVESTLKRVISHVLMKRVSDPRIVGMVSVTHVDVSPDCRHAAVYVSVVPDKYESRTVHGLQHATGYIYSLVCKSVSMRSVPHLDFRLDQSLKKQAQIFDAIQRGLAQEERLSGRLTSIETEPTNLEANWRDDSEDSSA